MTLYTVYTISLGKRIVSCKSKRFIEFYSNDYKQVKQLYENLQLTLIQQFVKQKTENISANAKTERSTKSQRYKIFSGIKKN